MREIKLKKCCSSDQTVVEILGDDDIYKEVVVDDIHTESDLNTTETNEKTDDENIPLEKSCTNNVTTSDLLDVYEDIIRDNCWMLCDRCSYKTKSRKGLRKDIAKMHEKVAVYQNSPEEIKPFWYYQCNLCEY